MIGIVAVWFVFIVISEALNEIIRTAGPLEGIRAYFSRKSRFISDLISCGYCTSVWVGMSLGWILPPVMPEIGAIPTFINTYLWWFINGILLHRLSNVFHDFINKRHVYTLTATQSDDDSLNVVIEGK